MDIVLASTSPYRRALLDRLPIQYRVLSPNYSETWNPNRSPKENIKAHALGKAQSLWKKHPRAWIIGSDQGVIAHRQLLGKPLTISKACKQLLQLQGQTHELVTALALVNFESQKVLTHVDVHTLVFRPLTREAICKYVELEQPLDCAGSFKIESMGPLLFQSIQGNDPTAIMGLPLMALVSLFQKAGISLL